MPEKFRISELPTSASFNDADIMEVSQVDNDSPSGFSSVKKTVLDIANKILKNINFTSDLNTTDKTVIGAINEVDGDIPANSDFSLSGLSDTTITSPSSGQVLSYDGGKWKNKNAEYKVGDSISMSAVICAGIVATTKKDIRFFIPLSKPINSGVTKVNISGRWDCRSTLGQFTNDDLSNYGTVTTTICPNGVYVRLQSTNDLNVDINMPISAYGSGTATLSFSDT